MGKPIEKMLLKELEKLEKLEYFYDSYENLFGIILPIKFYADNFFVFMSTKLIIIFKLIDTEEGEIISEIQGKQAKKLCKRFAKSMNWRGYE
jgi:hypothetical protein